MKKILFLLMALVLLITGYTVAPVPACADVENCLHNCGIEETAHFVYTRYDVDDGRLYGIVENPYWCSRCYVRTTFFFWDNTFHVIVLPVNCYTGEFEVATIGQVAYVAIQLVDRIDSLVPGTYTTFDGRGIDLTTWKPPDE